MGRKQSLSIRKPINFGEFSFCFQTENLISDDGFKPFSNACAITQAIFEKLDRFLKKGNIFPNSPVVVKCNTTIKKMLHLSDNII